MHNSTNSPTIVGIDIGYGNLKVVGGTTQGAQTREVVLPAGAAPISSMPRMNDKADLKGGELVLLNGREWVGGVEQFHIQNGVKKTHEQYSTELEYEALFLAGLARLGYEHINLLVTGLPVSQFYGPHSASLKAGLVRVMQGRKHVSDRLTVTIDKVVVVPQPYGTWMSMASLPEYSYMAESDSSIGLVADPGYFSVDIVAMVGPSVMQDFSDSSQLATSYILEKAAARITAETGTKMHADRLDMMLRRGHDSVEIRNSKVDFRRILQEEAKEVGADVASLIASKLRNMKGEIDYIILTGGGAWLYERALRHAFPNCAVSNKIVTPADPVIANARGYFVSGRQSMLDKARSTRSAA